MQTQPIKLLDINVTQTNARSKLDLDAIADYQDRWTTSKWPPLVVYHDGTHYWLAEGQHRIVAATHLELQTVDCVVHKGGVRDAIKHAISGQGNRDHGVRRSYADKRKAVEMALEDEEWRQLSDRAIAEMCGVSNTMVGEMRPRVVESTVNADSEEPRKGKDGRKQKPASGKRKAAGKKKAEPTPEPNQPATDAEDETDFDPAKLDATPHASIDIKGLATPYAEAVRALNKLATDFEARAGEERTGAHLADKITRLKHHLGEAREIISQATPVCVCLQCDGQRCNACANTGFWTRAIQGSRKS